MFLEHIFGLKSKNPSKKSNIKIVDGKIIEEEIESYNVEKDILADTETLPKDIIMPFEIEDKVESITQKQGRPPKEDDFFITLEVAGRSKRTIETYRYAIKYWEIEAKKRKKSIYTMKYRDVEGIMIKWQSNTRRKRYSALNQLSRWYLREGYPNLSIELSKVIKTNERKSRIPKAKSIEEFKEIREACKDMVKNEKREGIWLGLMLLCGLRISEIETVECGEDYIQVIGKGSKERRVPCPQWLLEKLKKSERDGRGESGRDAVEERERERAGEMLWRKEKGRERERCCGGKRRGTQIEDSMPSRS